MDHITAMHRVGTLYQVESYGKQASSSRCIVDIATVDMGVRESVLCALGQQ